MEDEMKEVEDVNKIERPGGPAGLRQINTVYFC